LEDGLPLGVRFGSDVWTILGSSEGKLFFRGLRLGPFIGKLVCTPDGCTVGTRLVFLDVCSIGPLLKDSLGGHDGLLDRAGGLEKGEVVGFNKAAVEGAWIGALLGVPDGLLAGISVFNKLGSLLVAFVGPGLPKAIAEGAAMGALEGVSDGPVDRPDADGRNEIVSLGLSL
jgi:hypothetical protein